MWDSFYSGYSASALFPTKSALLVLRMVLIATHNLYVYFSGENFV